MGSLKCIEAISAVVPGAPMFRGDDANLTFER
jgi:hypothetical protein